MTLKTHLAVKRLSKLHIQNASVIDPERTGLRTVKLYIVVDVIYALSTLKIKLKTHSTVKRKVKRTSKTHV
jgi:hypothetical protein